MLSLLIHLLNFLKLLISKVIFKHSFDNTVVKIKHIALTPFFNFKILLDLKLLNFLNDFLIIETA